MRNEAPAIAPFIRSDALGRLLSVILVGEREELSLSEVAAGAQVPLTTVQREVDRLAAAGVVETRKLGPARLVRANEEYPLLSPLRQIIAAAFGPIPVIQEAFQGLPGLERLIIFGSWAARINGAQGRFPGDVDVLVVGTGSRLEAIECALDASERVGREVNVTVVRPERWNGVGDGFIADIKSKDHLELEVTGWTHPIRTKQDHG